MIRVSVLLSISLACFAPCVHAENAQSTVVMGKEFMKLSSTGPENLLPSFFFLAGGEEGGDFVAGKGWSGGQGAPNPFHPPDTCPDDIFENTSPDLRVPVLPYLEQDDWGCEREPTNVSVIVLENEYLRAAITPQVSTMKFLSCNLVVKILVGWQNLVLIPQKVQKTTDIQ
eukprot:m.218226 g.218226  ORF g.218226 m.218226 type:complete len:171 (+) comp15902_c0_seq8:38-550(+)